MADFSFKSFCLIFLSEYCYNEFFIEFNFFHVECLKAFISKGLGLAIVAGAVFVKVPQIIKIYNAKSAQGISLVGTSLELCAIVANVSYNFVNRYPFSAYGDGFFLLLQTSLVGAMVLHYSGAKEQAALFLASVGTVSISLCSGMVPMSVLLFLTAANIPIVVCGKLVQAWANYKNRSTGQLSAITMTMMFLGSTARIFTSIQETGDNVIIATYTASTLANAVIMAQLVMYWDVATKKTKQKVKKQQ